MEDDISTLAKIAIVVTILAIGISMVIVILSVSVNTGKKVSEPFSSASSILGKNIYELSLEKSVAAPVAYKILQQNESAIRTLSITVNSITYSGIGNASVLLKNAGKNVSVTLVERSDYGYDVTVREVR